MRVHMHLFCSVNKKVNNLSQTVFIIDYSHRPQVCNLHCRLLIQVIHTVHFRLYILLVSLSSLISGNNCFLLAQPTGNWQVGNNNVHT